MALPSIGISQDDARAELAKRELARRRFVDFETYVAHYYRPARHHYLVGEYLEQVETYIRTRGATGIGRLLILEPPRHGKSEQASRHFPAWVLGRMPDMRVIITSYGLDLATKFSRAVRDIVTGERFKNVFGERSAVDAPVELSSDSRSVQAWDLAAPHRGGVIAAGVGGGITGMGANLFVVDDPLKNREEAESQAHRDRVWEWWTSTAYTRLEDGAAVVGMLTRWHGDDWAGRLLRLMASDPQADQYVILSLPAVWEEPQVPEGKTFDEYHRTKLLEGIWMDEHDPLDRQPGEALWPVKYSVGDLDRIKRNIGDYDYEALYQQWPYLRSGSIFKREWFTIVDQGPAVEEITARVRYWDKAASADGDYTVGPLMALTRDGGVWVEHVARYRLAPGERDREMLKTAQLDMARPGPKPVQWHQQDPGSAGKDSAQATNRMFAAAGITARFEPVSGEKIVRAGPWSSACQGGRVRLVRGSWIDAYIEEHVAFDKGKFDDQVDASASAYNKITAGVQTKQAGSFQG